MTALEMWTGVAIWTLIFGSALVFAWFARDLRRLVRSLDHPEDPGAGERPEVDVPTRLPGDAS